MDSFFAKQAALILVKAHRDYPWTEGLFNETPVATPEIPPAIQRQIDVLQARVEYPQAPADVLSLLNGNAEEIRGAAKRLHEMAVAAAVVPPPPALAPAPADPANVPPAGGGPVPVPGSGQVTPPEHQTNARYEELQAKAERKSLDEFERDEFFLMALRGDNGLEGWNPHMQKLNERPGRARQQ